MVVYLLTILLSGVPTQQARSVVLSATDCEVFAKRLILRGAQKTPPGQVTPAFSYTCEPVPMLFSVDVPVTPK